MEQEDYTSKIHELLASNEPANVSLAYEIANCFGGKYPDMAPWDAIFKQYGAPISKERFMTIWEERKKYTQHYSLDGLKYTDEELPEYLRWCPKLSSIPNP